MQKLTLIFIAIFLSNAAFSQTTYTIQGDSVRLLNDAANAELIIENATRDTAGFLYNKGNGRTEFKRALTKLDDSTYLVGADTLHTNSAGGGNSNNTLQQAFDKSVLAGDNPTINGYGNSLLEQYGQVDTNYSAGLGFTAIVPAGEHIVTSGADTLFRFFSDPLSSYLQSAQMLRDTFAYYDIGIYFSFNEEQSQNMFVVGGKFTSRIPMNITITNIGYGGSTASLNITNSELILSQTSLYRDRDNISLTNLNNNFYIGKDHFKFSNPVDNATVLFENLPVSSTTPIYIAAFNGDTLTKVEYPLNGSSGGTLQNAFDADATANPQINAGDNPFTIRGASGFNINMPDELGNVGELDIQSYRSYLSNWNTTSSAGIMVSPLDLMNTQVRLQTNNNDAGFPYMNEFSVHPGYSLFSGKYGPFGQVTNSTKVAIENADILLTPPEYIWAADGDTLKKYAYAVPGSGSGVQTVTGTTVDNSDPINPILTVPTLQQSFNSDPTAKFDMLSLENDFEAGFHSIDMVAVGNESGVNARVSAIDTLSGNSTALEVLPHQLNLESSTGSGININNSDSSIFIHSGSYKTIIDLDSIDAPMNMLWQDGLGYIHKSAIIERNEWGSITGTLVNQTDLQDALNLKQNNLTLTTTGTSGAPTLVGSTLNIPDYSSGGGGTYSASNGLTMSGNDVKLGGTLLAATTLNSGNNTLSINGTKDSYTGVLSVLNNGTSPAIRAESNASNNSSIIGISTGTNGSGVTGNATSLNSIGVSGVNASSGIGGEFYSASGLPIYGILNNGTPNGLNTLLSLVKGGVNGSNANGIGGSIDFSLADNSSLKLSNQLISTISDLSNFTTQFSITGKNAGSSLTLFTLSGNGSTKLNRYGLGTFPGTPTYNLATTSTGDIIETSMPIYGTATLTSGTVTVNTGLVKTGAKIYVSVNTPGGTRGFISAPTGSIVNSTSFVINSTSATETSTVNWQIIN